MTNRNEDSNAPRFLRKAELILFIAFFISTLGAIAMYSGMMALSPIIFTIIVVVIVFAFMTYRLYGKSAEGRLWLLFFIALIIFTVIFMASAALVSGRSDKPPSLTLTISLMVLAGYLPFLFVLIMRIRTEQVEFTTKRIGRALVFVAIALVGPVAMIISQAGTMTSFQFIYLGVLAAIIVLMGFLTMMLLQHLLAFKSPYFKVWLYFIIAIIIMISASIVQALARNALEANPILMMMQQVFGLSSYVFFGLAAIKQRKIIVEMFGG